MVGMEENGVDVRGFFSSSSSSASKGEKKRVTKKKEDDSDVSEEVAKSLASWDACRLVFKSLSRMGMTHISLASMRKAVPDIDYSVLRHVGKVCPRAVVVDDDIVVFPGLSETDRARGVGEERARRRLVKKALVKEPVVSVEECPKLVTTVKDEGDIPVEDSAAIHDGEAPLVRFLRSLTWYEDQIAHVEVVPKRQARFAQAELLQLRTQRQLYAHQATAIDAALSGKHVALCTGTASGKTLAYSLPTIQAALADNDSCVALFLFPTKALSQDQVAAFRELADGRATIAALDGDTDRVDRETISSCPPNVVVTNPDMIHHTLLHDSQYESIFSRLRYVVVDEAHVYVGAFGSHVSAILRRLRRKNDKFSYFCCSATIANPREHVSKLIGEKADELVVVDDDASPRGCKSVVIWNPPLHQNGTASIHQASKKKRQKKKVAADWRTERPAFLVADSPAPAVAPDYELLSLLHKDERSRLLDMKQSRDEMVVAMRKRRQEGGEGEGGGEEDRDYDRRKSPIYELAHLFACLVMKGVRTLAFARTRKLVELVLGYARDLLPSEAQQRVAAYRGGYVKAERRVVERGLFGGELTGVVATCALELGVDVGNLDATLHLGHPGSIASLWQQAGRAGRAEQKSIAVVVCWDSPVDQQFARCGSELLRRPVEAAALEVSNECVLRDHVLCAAAELPLDETVDKSRFGGDPVYSDCVDHLRASGKLVKVDGGGFTAHPLARQACHKAVNIRLIDPVTFEVKHTTTREIMDTVPYSRAFFELYEGAVYLHQAKPHKIVKLDLRTHEAWASPLPRCSYHTSSRNHTDVDVVSRLETTMDVVSTGVVHVTKKVWGYRKVCRRTGRMLSLHEFSLPSLEMQTRGTWIDVPPEAIEEIKGNDSMELLAGIHAMNHALLVVAPLFVCCDKNDISSEHAYPYQLRPRPSRVVVFDSRPGGLGVVDQLFRRIRPVLVHTLSLLTSCPCSSSAGCPACLHHSSCSAYNLVLDRPAAAIIAASVLRRATVTTTPPTSPSCSRTKKRGLLEEANENTPRRALRARSLKIAGAMDARRPGAFAPRAAIIQSQWVPCIPDFCPDKL